MTSDGELLAAWAGGDREAGQELYRRYADRVTRFFARKTDDELPDLVQRTFLNALEAVRAGTRVDSPAGFLFAIARNELYDQFKRVRPVDPEVTSLADVRTGLSTRYARHEQERFLLDALARLPLDAQLALELYYWEELAMDDVARALGVTRSAALNRVHRARAQLREQLPADAVQALETRPEPS